MTARHGQYRLVAAKELPAKVRIPLYSNHSGHFLQLGPTGEGGRFTVGIHRHNRLGLPGLAVISDRCHTRHRPRSVPSGRSRRRSCTARGCCRPADTPDTQFLGLLSNDGMNVGPSDRLIAIAHARRADDGLSRDTERNWIFGAHTPSPYAQAIWKSNAELQSQLHGWQVLPFDATP